MSYNGQESNNNNFKEVVLMSTIKLNIFNKLNESNQIVSSTEYFFVNDLYEEI